MTTDTIAASGSSAMTGKRLAFALLAPVAAGGFFAAAMFALMAASWPDPDALRTPLVAAGFLAGWERVMVAVSAGGVAAVAAWCAVAALRLPLRSTFAHAVSCIPGARAHHGPRGSAPAVDVVDHG